MVCNDHSYFIVVKEFKLTEVQGTNVIIFDNLDTRIKNDEELRFVLEHFYKSSTFFIKLQFVDTNKDVSLITSDVSFNLNFIFTNKITHV